MDFGAAYKKENTEKSKSIAGDKESESEKEDKGQEKTAEEEKFYTRNNHIITTQFDLPGEDKFICFSTKLNKHPYHEDDIQPPKAV